MENFPPILTVMGNKLITAKTMQKLKEAKPS